MKKYLILYKSPVSSQDQMNVSPEELKRGLQAWTNWFTKLGDAIIDPGNQVGNAMNVSKIGLSKAQSSIGGYSIVQADDIEAVETMVADNPNLGIPDASIEILEIMPMI